MFSLTLAFAASVFAAAADKEFAFDFQPKKQGDTIVMEKPEKDKPVVFVVTSKSGIGGGTLTLKSGEWPARMVLRFRHEEKASFKDLEGFEATTSRMHIQGSAKESGQMSFMLLDADGKIIDRNAAGSIKVEVSKAGGNVDVMLPTYLFTGSKEVKLQWIDFLRN